MVLVVKSLFLDYLNTDVEYPLLCIEDGVTLVTTEKSNHFGWKGYSTSVTLLPMGVTFDPAGSRHLYEMPDSWYFLITDLLVYVVMRF